MTGTIELFKHILQANLPPIYLFLRIAAEKLVDRSRLGTEREGNDQLRRKPNFTARAYAIFKQTACKFWRIRLTASPCGYRRKSPCQALILV